MILAFSFSWQGLIVAESNILVRNVHGFKVTQPKQAADAASVFHDIPMSGSVVGPRTQQGAIANAKVSTDLIRRESAGGWTDVGMAQINKISKPAKQAASQVIKEAGSTAEARKSVVSNLIKATLERDQDVMDPKPRVQLKSAFVSNALAPQAVPIARPQPIKPRPVPLAERYAAQVAESRAEALPEPTPEEIYVGEAEGAEAYVPLNIIVETDGQGEFPPNVLHGEGKTQGMVLFFEGISHVEDGATVLVQLPDVANVLKFLLVISAYDPTSNRTAVMLVSQEDEV